MFSPSIEVIFLLSLWIDTFLFGFADINVVDALLALMALNHLFLCHRLIFLVHPWCDHIIFTNMAFESVIKK